MICKVKNGRKGWFGFDSYDCFDDHQLKVLAVSGPGHKEQFQWSGGLEPGWRKVGMEPYTSSAIGVCLRCKKTIELFSDLPADLYKLQLEMKYGKLAPDSTLPL